MALTLATICMLLAISHAYRLAAPGENYGQDHYEPSPSSHKVEFPSLPSSVNSKSQLPELQEQKDFRAFVKAHNKNYGTSEEYKKRYNIFRENMKKVQYLRETERGTATYGASPFADMTEEEFQKHKLGLKPFGDYVYDWPNADIPEVELPAAFDWRDHGAVTPVKNQGQCGSCWAFSVTGNVEGQWKLRRGELLSLSEQELVDCDKYDYGCDGGYPANAYKAMQEIGGLELETDYTYAGDDEQCNFDESKVKVVVTGGLKISANETKMAQWLMTNGPVSILINAKQMHFYMGGIAHPQNSVCSPEGLNHAVLIVGFGIEHNIPFWIVKNSWSSAWGEIGYYRIYRGDGACGLNEFPTTATVD